MAMIRRSGACASTPGCPKPSPTWKPGVHRDGGFIRQEFCKSRWATRRKATPPAQARLREGRRCLSAGVLQIAMGDTQKGNASLHEALLAPETRMSYHLSRLALAGATPRPTPR